MPAAREKQGGRQVAGETPEIAATILAKFAQELSEWAKKESARLTTARQRSKIIGPHIPNITLLKEREYYCKVLQKKFVCEVVHREGAF
jgi:hypothetical protein